MLLPDDSEEFFRSHEDPYQSEDECKHTYKWRCNDCMYQSHNMSFLPHFALNMQYFHIFRKVIYK